MKAGCKIEAGQLLRLYGETVYPVEGSEYSITDAINDEIHRKVEDFIKTHPGGGGAKVAIIWSSGQWSVDIAEIPERGTGQ